MLLISDTVRYLQHDSVNRTRLPPSKSAKPPLPGELQATLFSLPSLDLMGNRLLLPGPQGTQGSERQSTEPPPRARSSQHAAPKGFCVDPAWLSNANLAQCHLIGMPFGWHPPDFGSVGHKASDIPPSSTLSHGWEDSSAAICNQVPNANR